jgi:hypothetical protein
MTLKLMEDQLHIKWKNNCQILHEDLGQRKMFAKLVPHSLMNEQLEHSVTTGEDVIQTCQMNPNFVSCIITANESWNFLL